MGKAFIKLILLLAFCNLILCSLPTKLSGNWKQINKCELSTCCCPQVNSEFEIQSIEKFPHLMQLQGVHWDNNNECRNQGLASKRSLLLPFSAFQAPSESKIQSESLSGRQYVMDRTNFSKNHEISLGYKRYNGDVCNWEIQLQLEPVVDEPKNVEGKSSKTWFILLLIAILFIVGSLRTWRRNRKDKKLLDFAQFELDNENPHSTSEEESK